MAYRHPMSRRAFLPFVLIAPLLAACSDLKPVGTGAESYTAAPTGKLHVVARGDTASEIASRYGITLRELAAANGLRKPYVIKLGSKLRIPGGAAPAEDPEPEKATARASTAPTGRMLGEVVTAGNGKQLAALPPARTIAPGARGKLAPPTPEEAERAANAKPPALTGDGFLWPASGRIVSRFGAKDDGRVNDGINIAAERGSPVIAAENGIVAYAGDEIAGWGRMILIRHADNFTTAYAHLDALAVRVGDTVRRGQPIGLIGQTGNVDQPQLHFELRSGKRALNPNKLLVNDGVTTLASR